MGIDNDTAEVACEAPNRAVGVEALLERGGSRGQIRWDLGGVVVKEGGQSRGRGPNCGPGIGESGGNGGIDPGVRLILMMIRGGRKREGKTRRVKGARVKDKERVEEREKGKGGVFCCRSWPPLKLCSIVEETWFYWIASVEIWYNY